MRNSRCRTGSQLPSTPGVYALILASTGRRPAAIGRLGAMRLERGFYVYVGSAFGPGGLQGRLAHHCRGPKQPRWHIDYLRLQTVPDRVWFSCGGREHQWAAAMSSMPGACVPLVGFGASDCGCESHLLFFRRRPALAEFRRRLRRLDGAGTPVQVRRLRREEFRGRRRIALSGPGRRRAGSTWPVARAFRKDRHGHASASQPAPRAC